MDTIAGCTWGISRTAFKVFRFNNVTGFVIIFSLLLNDVLAMTASRTRWQFSRISGSMTQLRKLNYLVDGWFNSSLFPRDKTICWQWRLWGQRWWVETGNNLTHACIVLLRVRGPRIINLGNNFCYQWHFQGSVGGWKQGTTWFMRVLCCSDSEDRQLLTSGIT